MAPPLRRPSASRSVPCVLALAAAALTLACPSDSGGGGDDGGEGGVGKGADGVTIFWWGYGEELLGWGSQARPLDDGSFVVVGSRSSEPYSFDPATYDAWLLVTDERGEPLWERTFGQDGLREVAYDVVALTGGGFMLVGEATESQANPPEDMLLACTDAAGASVWDERHGEEGFDSARAALEVPGGFLVAGARSCEDLGTGRQAALVQLGANGQVLWEQLYGEEGIDEAWGLVAATNGGYALAGYKSGTPADPGDELWLIRTDADGQLAWERTYGKGHVYGLAPTADDGFVLTGFVDDEGALDLVVLRTDAEGNELWRRVLGGDDDDVGRAVSPRPGGGFLVAGYTQSFTPGFEPWARQDVYLIALDEDGEVIFQKVKGQAPNSSERADSVVPTPDGGMILTGSWDARLLLMKADKNGDTVGLGDQDVSLDLPDVDQGLIGFSDVVPTAEAALDLLFTAREMGPFAVEHLVAVLEGATPDEFCPLGGTFTIEPPPQPPLEGKSFHVVFDICQTDPIDPMALDGFYNLGIGALTGDLTAPPYVLASTMTDVMIAVHDNAGTTIISGYTTFDRTMSGAGAYTDFTGLVPGATLGVEVNGEMRLSDFLELETSLSSGKHTMGPVLAHLMHPGVPAWLDMYVEASDPLTGSDPYAPSKGSLRIQAVDGSRLVLRALDDEEVQLELDTDGDGTNDLTVVTLWEFLY
jgi:hypothetical protein